MENNNVWAIARIYDEEKGLVDLEDLRYFGKNGFETAKKKVEKLNDGLVLTTEHEYFLVVVGHK